MYPFDDTTLYRCTATKSHTPVGISKILNRPESGGLALGFFIAPASPLTKVTALH